MFLYYLQGRKCGGGMCGGGLYTPQTYVSVGLPMNGVGLKI